MTYVVRDDIIASIDSPIIITQGDSINLTITLSRDSLGNQLAASNISSISAAIVDDMGETVLVYTKPANSTASGEIILSDPNLNTPGEISFEITSQHSRLIPVGNINLKITKL